MTQVFVAALSLGLATSAFAADCSQGKQIDYARKADLPSGARAMIDMAEAGAPFQHTDVVVGKPLPFKRFVSARRIGCRLQINFEHGGRGYSHENLDFDLIEGHWTIHEGRKF